MAWARMSWARDGKTASKSARLVEEAIIRQTQRNRGESKGKNVLRTVIAFPPRRDTGLGVFGPFVC